MMGFFWNMGAFIVALGLLIFVHELGHFSVARWCGVQVQRFAIGFGPTLWSSKDRYPTEYVIGLIPLGGYVKMLDGRVDSLTPATAPHAFDTKSVWQRMAIVAAGPVANFLFAIAAFWLMLWLGVPAVKPVIGTVAPDSIAAQAHVQPQSVIVAVNGQPTADWEAVTYALIQELGQSSLTLTTQAKDSTTVADHHLAISTWRLSGQDEPPLAGLGITPFVPATSLTLAQVLPNGAGQAAGLQPGDTLLSLNGQPLTRWDEVMTTIQASPDIPLTLGVQREQMQLSLKITPQSKSTPKGNIGYAGLAPQIAPFPEEYRITVEHSVWSALQRSLIKTQQLAELTFKMAVKLVTGDISLNNLSGPVSIAKGAGTTADYGFVYFLGFLALISVNLGIMNLLPLPVLDGGHLVFFICEAILGRPVPESIQVIGVRIGTLVLMTVMGIALFNDFMRL